MTQTLPGGKGNIKLYLVLIWAEPQVFHSLLWKDRFHFFNIFSSSFVAEIRFRTLVDRKPLQYSRQKV